jgi:hypothetical protein
MKKSTELFINTIGFGLNLASLLFSVLTNAWIFAGINLFFIAWTLKRVIVLSDELESKEE